MADKEEKKKAERKDKYTRATNWIKRKARIRIGGWFSHLKEKEVEERINVEKELAKEGLLTIFAEKIRLLWEIEEAWSEFTGYWMKLQELYKKVGFVRNVSQAYKEAGYLKFGSKEKAKTSEDFMKELSRIPDDKEEELDKDTLKNLDETRIDIKGNNGKIIDEVWMKYPVPIEVPMKFWSSWINDRANFCNNYEVSYTGFTRRTSWINVYNKIIDETVDKILQKLPDKDNDQVKANIVTIKDSFHDFVGRLFTKYMFKRENSMFSKIKTLGDEVTNLENLRSNIYDRRPSKYLKNIYFKHTYKIINPDLIIDHWDYERFNVLSKKNPKTLLVDPKKGIDELEELDDLKARWDECIKESDLEPTGRNGLPERVPGVDEYGWPLEVTYPGYEFNGWKADGYYVLLDIFNIKGDTPGDYPGNARKLRKDVVKNFVVDMDLLMMANSMNNEWDAIRDDVRDGRYHTNSLTILDSLMITIPKEDWSSGIAGWRWMEKQENKLMDKKFAEEYRTPTMSYFDGTTRKETKVLRKPNDLIPAFDKRAIIGKGDKARDEFWHVGRKYYYMAAKRIWELTDDDLKHQGVQKAIDSVITSRGVSQYIIYKILFGMKYYDQARARLIKIAQDRGVWYDYGPRDFEVKALAADGTPDPMSVDLTSANKSLDIAFVRSQIESAVKKVEEK